MDNSGNFYRQEPDITTEPSTTLTGKFQGTHKGAQNPRVTDGLMVRRLTPDECMRLQSAPDDWVWPEGMSKTAKFRIAGNGWACAIAAAFARAFHESDPEARTVIDLFCGGGLGAVGWHQRYWRAAQTDAGEPGGWRQAIGCAPRHPKGSDMTAADAVRKVRDRSTTP